MSTVAENVISALRTRKLPQKPWLTGLSLAAADAAAISVATSVGLCAISLWTHQPGPLSDGLIAVVSALFVFGTLGLYTMVGLSPVQEFQRVMVGSAAGYAVAAAVLFLRLHSRYALVVLTLAWFATIVLVPVCRD